MFFQWWLVVNLGVPKKPAASVFFFYNEQEGNKFLWNFDAY